MFGLIDDAERMRWQLAAVRVLAGVLKSAIEVGLPRVSWRLGSGKTLVAECLHGDDRQRQAAFYAWATFLVLPERREWDSAGRTHLQASRPDYQGCQVILTADLFHDPVGTNDAGGGGWS